MEGKNSACLSKEVHLSRKINLEHDHLAFDLFLTSLCSQHDETLGEEEGTFLMVILTQPFEYKAILYISKIPQNKKGSKRKH